MKSRKSTYEYVNDNIENDNDNKAPLNNAIDHNDIEKLNKLLQQEKDHKLKKNNSLAYAAQLGHWPCVKMLIEYSKRNEKYYGSHDFLKSMNEVLFLAATENQIEVMKGIFDLIKLHKKTNKNIVDDEILYHRTKLMLLKLRRDNKGYTSLHWAVQNNNPQACQLFACFAKIEGEELRHYGGDAPIYRAKDKNGLTAFELAVSLNHIECAKKIAIGMSYQYILFKAKSDVLCKSFLQNVTFGFDYSGAIYSDIMPSKEKVAEIKKMIYEHVLKLPGNEKKIAFEQITNNGNALYWLFNIGSQKTSEKYINDLMKHINAENNSFKRSSRVKFMKELVPLEDTATYPQQNKEAPQAILVKTTHGSPQWRIHEKGSSEASFVSTDENQTDDSATNNYIITRRM